MLAVSEVARRRISELNYDRIGVGTRGENILEDWETAIDAQFGTQGPKLWHIQGPLYQT